MKKQLPPRPTQIIRLAYAPSRLRTAVLKTYLKALNEFTVAEVRASRIVDASGIVANQSTLPDRERRVHAIRGILHDTLEMTDEEKKAIDVYRWYPDTGVIEIDKSIEQAVRCDRAADPTRTTERIDAFLASPMAKRLVSDVREMVCNFVRRCT